MFDERFIKILWTKIYIKITTIGKKPINTDYSALTEKNDQL